MLFGSIKRYVVIVSEKHYLEWLLRVPANCVSSAHGSSGGRSGLGESQISTEVGTG